MTASPPRAPAQPRDLAASLLSIDVDRELSKILERRFRTPEQFLVELVRAACARGAQRIDVELSARGITLTDDGRPLPPASLHHLQRLLDRARPTEERQAALAALEDETETGVLAALACAPTRLELRSGDGRSGFGFTLVRDRPRMFDRLHTGTWLRLARRGAVSRERALLLEAAAHASVAIVVNGATISRRPLPGLLRAALQGPGGLTGTLAIPDQDDLCHATRLQHGLRVDEQVRPAVAGLVFELVFDAAAGWPADLWQRATVQAEQLYEELVGRYASLSANARARVDALMFLLYRSQPQHRLLARWAPFQVLGQDRRWSLGQVQEAAQAGSLTALVEGADPRRHDTRGQVLWLTPAQREFLVEQLRLPLAAPLQAPRPPGWWQRLPRWLQRGWRRGVERLAQPSRSRVARTDLPAAQRVLVDTMQQALASGRWRPAGSQPLSPVGVSDARSRTPLRRVASADATAAPELVLFRRHHLVQQATRALARDPDNLRLLLAALLGGEDAWHETP